MAKVFISYRQIDDAQRQRVRAFADRVQGCGIDVVLDQFYKDTYPGGPPEGWPKWSSDQAITSERVLIIGNEPWFRCFDGTEIPGVGLGAACEAGNLRQRLYELSGLNEIIRVAYFDRADVDSISFDLKRYERFHADDDFVDLIAWLGGTPVTATPLTSASAALWPSRCTTFLPDMANRENEFEFFAETLCQPNGQRGTLICADSDHGKTRLVAQFHQYGCEAIGAEACCMVDFKGNGTTDYLLDTVAQDLGGLIPEFKSRDPSRLREGLKRATRPVLFLFDTFEKATEDARRLVETHFLADITRASSMRILLAGQRVEFPDPNRAAWGAYAKRFDLGSIPDPQPWIVWAKRRFPSLAAQEVRLIVAATKGVPGSTAAMLETLGNYTPAQLKVMGIKK